MVLKVLELVGSSYILFKRKLKSDFLIMLTLVVCNDSTLFVEMHGCCIWATQTKWMIHRLNSSINQFITSCLRILDQGGRKTRHCEDTWGGGWMQDKSQVQSWGEICLSKTIKYFKKFLNVFGEHLNISVLITWRDIIRWLWLLSGKANKPHDQSMYV